ELYRGEDTDSRGIQPELCRPDHPCQQQHARDVDQRARALARGEVRPTAHDALTQRLPAHGCAPCSTAPPCAVSAGASSASRSTVTCASAIRRNRFCVKKET